MTTRLSFYRLGSGVSEIGIFSVALKRVWVQRLGVTFDEPFERDEPENP